MASTHWNDFWMARKATIDSTGSLSGSLVSLLLAAFATGPLTWLVKGLEVSMERPKSFRSTWI
jgi:hypothetical protein